MGEMPWHVSPCSPCSQVISRGERRIFSGPRLQEDAGMREERRKGGKAKMCVTWSALFFLSRATFQDFSTELLLSQSPQVCQVPHRDI